jgi:hypothetical protein
VALSVYIVRNKVESTSMGLRNLLRACFTPAVMIGMLLVAILLLAIVFLFVGWVRPGPVPGEAGTAVVKIIQAPTDTQIPTAIPSIVNPTPQPVEDRIVLGSSVQISGTGGDGLRLRYSPGLESKVRLLGSEGEVFDVTDGPEQVDNYIWWYLENPQDQSRRGWAVEEFLQPVQVP